MILLFVYIAPCINFSDYYFVFIQIKIIYNSIRRLASYANPEFYAKQAMRQSTFKIPRVTVVYEEDSESIILPRGVEYKNHDEWHITEIYQHICESNYRNGLISADIVNAIETGRNPLVLTERTKGRPY